MCLIFCYIFLQVMIAANSASKEKAQVGIDIEILFVFFWNLYNHSFLRDKFNWLDHWAV